MKPGLIQECRNYGSGPSFQLPYGPYDMGSISWGDYQIQEIQGPSGPQLLAGGPSSQLNIVLRTFVLGTQAK